MKKARKTKKRILMVLLVCNEQTRVSLEQILRLNDLHVFYCESPEDAMMRLTDPTDTDEHLDYCVLARATWEQIEPLANCCINTETQCIAWCERDRTKAADEFDWLIKAVPDEILHARVISILSASVLESRFVSDREIAQRLHHLRL